jgi:hypothetical protein
MTPKQEERIRNKIKKIKAGLAADKKYWGGYYHDGQGLRYSPPFLYISINDFTGGLRYVNWFNKNFPDDAGYPSFLFEWLIILFKTGRLKEAEKKAFQTFTRNTYVFDKFFERPIKPIEKWEGSNLESAGYAISYFNYSHQQENLRDFALWLEEFTRTEKFLSASKKYIEILVLLNSERDVEKITELSREIDQLGV